MGKLQYVVVQENPAPAGQGRKLSLGTAQIPAALEAAIYAVWPTEIVVPPAPPSPPSTPNAVLVRKADKLMDKARTLKAGQTLALERGGVWYEPLALSSGHDGCSVVAFGTGPMPLIIGQFGLMLYGPTDGLVIDGIWFRGNKGTDGYGVQALTPAIRNFTLKNSVVQGFRMNVMFQHPAAAKAPFAEWHRNLSFANNMLLDSQGSGERDGQGMYLENVDGASVFENMIDGAGMNRTHTDGRPIYSIYCHGMYLQAGCKRVNVVRNIVSRAESYGIQARGPDLAQPGEDTTDPGASVRDNIMIDCAIGFTVDAGTRGTATGNVVIPGHFHYDQYHHGQGGGIIHCGGGDFTGNTRLDAKAPDMTRQDWRMPFMDLSPDGTDADHPWRWNKAVSGKIDGRDYCGKGVTVDRNLLNATINGIRNRATGDNPTWSVGQIRDGIAALVEGAISTAARMAGALH